MRTFFPLFIIIFVIGIWAANQYLNPIRISNPTTSTPTPTTTINNKANPTATSIPTVTNIQPTQQHHSVTRPGEGEGPEGE